MISATGNGSSTLTRNFLFFFVLKVVYNNDVSEAPPQQSSISSKLEEFIREKSSHFLGDEAPVFGRSYFLILHQF